jgi:hypothetical protein
VSVLPKFLLFEIRKVTFLLDGWFIKGQNGGQTRLCCAFIHMNCDEWQDFVTGQALDPS